MKLSIIVPTLNEAPVLDATLQRIADGLNAEDELLVIDGGSCDGTPEIARTYATHVLSSAKGRARQMNVGAAHAGGDTLLFVHADTLLPIEYRRCIEGQWGFFKVALSGNRFMFRVIGWFINHRSKLTRVATGDQCLFCRKTLFDAVGGFPEVDLMEDVALSKALRKRYRPTVVKAKAETSSRRWQARGTWRTIWLMWRLRWRYWRGADPSELARFYRG